MIERFFRKVTKGVKINHSHFCERMFSNWALPLLSKREMNKYLHPLFFPIPSSLLLLYAPPDCFWFSKSVFLHILSSLKLLLLFISLHHLNFITTANSFSELIFFETFSSLPRKDESGRKVRALLISLILILSMKSEVLICL